MTERTTTHEYPSEELRAMTDFYGGKACVLMYNEQMVEWAHILNAALEPFNKRV